MHLVEISRFLSSLSIGGFLDTNSSALTQTREDVEALFRPSAPRKAVTPTGYTYIGKRLKDLFRAYEKLADANPSQQPKKVNYIVFTDGEACA